MSDEGGQEWEKIRKAFASSKSLKPLRGKPFQVRCPEDPDAVVVTPGLTGIPRRVTRTEVEKVVGRSREVKRRGFEPRKPGHYSDLTYNSSYIVAMLSYIEYFNKL